MESRGGHETGLARISSHDEAVSARKKNLPDNFAAWTPECSERASKAPAGWTSSGLRAHTRRSSFVQCATKLVTLARKTSQLP